MFLTLVFLTSLSLISGPKFKDFLWLIQSHLDNSPFLSHCLKVNLIMEVKSLHVGSPKDYTGHILQGSGILDLRVLSTTDSPLCMADSKCCSCLCCVSPT